MSGRDWICHTPSTARTINQMMRTGPKIGPTLDVPLCCTVNRSARMTTVIGMTAPRNIGVATSRPSTAASDRLWASSPALMSSKVNSKKEFGAAVERGPLGRGLTFMTRRAKCGSAGPPGVSSLRSPADRRRPFRIWALIDNGAAPNVVAMGVEKDRVQRTAMQRWLE